MRRALFFICLMVLEPFTFAQEKSGSSICSSKGTCGECITASPNCAWCRQEDYEHDRFPRCDLISNINQNCAKAYIVNPKNTEEKSDKFNKKLSEAGTHPDHVVQIAPQKVTLKLRPGESFPLKVNFRQAKDYPLDLYYLMDLSKSMEDDKDKLAVLGDLLAERMSNITKNFQLGFGSFVDKVVMPYVSTVPEKLKAPCTNCAAPYGFKNHMKLSSHTDKFKTEVTNARVSGNLDAPEGGFDAIMQAMACDNQIGWRKQSRKLLLFSTDSGFHYAGDGKLGGIVKPNDGLCHLDSTGTYTESTSQDYPSLSQLNQKAIQKKVHMIFAVTANQLTVYEQLSLNLEGSSTGKLENDSSNVVDLVRNQYDKITSSVELKDNAGPEVQVTYYSRCLGNTFEKTGICKGLKVGNTVEFEVHVEVKNCPKDRSKWDQSFTIYPVGLNENLTVDLQMMCSCDCEKEGIRDSPKCSEGNGTYECGICNCYSNRFGRHCECGSDTLDKVQSDIGCRKTNESLICTGRGTCICNICHCATRENPEEEFSGQFCECDNFSCDRHEGKICSGKDHGTCKCGECQCEQGWTGRACECLASNASCIAPGSTQICSGNGQCVCGICKCFKAEEGRFSGQYCEECPTCAGKCNTYRPCVQCSVFQSGELTEEQCKNCSFKPEIVDKAEIEKDTERLCIFKDDDDCKFTFVYGFDEKNEPQVRVQYTKDCPPPVNILMIVLGVIGGIVAVGLCLLLIWKLLTTIHDRREFAKFEKDRQRAKWDTGENPIYKQATSKYMNPIYGGKN